MPYMQLLNIRGDVTGRMFTTEIPKSEYLKLRDWKDKAPKKETWKIMYYSDDGELKKVSETEPSQSIDLIRYAILKNASYRRKIGMTEFLRSDLAALLKLGYVKIDEDYNIVFLK